LEQRAIGFNCLNYLTDAEPSLYRHTMPSKEYMDANCINGTRIELAFPSCGNGEKSSPDHKSHMAYPSLVKEGNCPKGYDVHHPFLFYETIWATESFKGEDGEFTLSYGDPVGTGYHGDFIMGWESKDYLQNVLDTCTNMSGNMEDCALFTIDEESPAECKFKTPKSLEKDDCHGPREGMPVDIPIQYGPGPATKYAIAGRKGKETSGIEQSAAPSTFSERPTFSYTSADPKKTETAQGGIIVAAYSSGANADNKPAEAKPSHYKPAADKPSEYQAAPSPATTQVPDVEAAADACESSTTVTEGNTVIHVCIQETDVTVTATATQTSYAKNKRHAQHLQKHAHHR